MWLATEHGFFSAVFKEGQMHVRARMRKDLDNLIQLVWGRNKRLARPTIEVWPEADYRYRIRITQEQFVKAMSVLGADVNYDNFKSRIHGLHDQREKYPAYGQLWANLHRLQE